MSDVFDENDAWILKEIAQSLTCQRAGCRLGRLMRNGHPEPTAEEHEAALNAFTIVTDAGFYLST